MHRTLAHSDPPPQIIACVHRISYEYGVNTILLLLLLYEYNRQQYHVRFSNIQHPGAHQISIISKLFHNNNAIEPGTATTADRLNREPFVILSSNFCCRSVSPPQVRLYFDGRCPVSIAHHSTRSGLTYSTMIGLLPFPFVV